MALGPAQLPVAVAAAAFAALTLLPESPADAAARRELLERAARGEPVTAADAAR